MYQTKMYEVDVATKWYNMYTRFCENQPHVPEIVQAGTQAALLSC